MRKIIVTILSVLLMITFCCPTFVTANTDEGYLVLTIGSDGGWYTGFGASQGECREEIRFYSDCDEDTFIKSGITFPKDAGTFTETKKGSGVWNWDGTNAKAGNYNITYSVNGKTLCASLTVHPRDDTAEEIAFIDACKDMKEVSVTDGSAKVGKYYLWCLETPNIIYVSSSKQEMKAEAYDFYFESESDSKVYANENYVLALSRSKDEDDCYEISLISLSDGYTTILKINNLISARMINYYDGIIFLMTDYESDIDESCGTLVSVTWESMSFKVLIEEFYDGCYDYATSSTGRYIYSGKNGMQIYDCQKGKVIKTISAGRSPILKNGKLYYTKWDGNWCVYQANLDGSSPKKLFSKPCNMSDENDYLTVEKITKKYMYSYKTYTNKKGKLAYYYYKYNLSTKKISTLKKNTYINEVWS